MFKKTAAIISLLISFSICTSTYAQPESPRAVVVLKHTLRNFESPNGYWGRDGLVKFSQNSKMLGVNGKEDSISLYNVETGEMIFNIPTGEGNISAFAFSNDDKAIVMSDFASYDIEVWDLENNRQKYDLGKRSPMSSLQRITVDGKRKEQSGRSADDIMLSPDRKLLLAGVTEGKFQIINLEDGKVRFEIEQAGKPSTFKDLMKIMFIPGSPLIPNLFHFAEARYSKDGKRIILANGDRVPTIWDAETGKMIAGLKAHQDSVYFAGFSADSKLVATSDVKGFTKIWSAEDGKELATFGSKKQRQYVIAWSPDNSKMATFTNDNQVDLYSAEGKLIAHCEISDNTRKLAFSPDGKLLATMKKDDGKVIGRIYDTETGKILATLPRRTGIDSRGLSVEWTRDGKYLVTAAKDYVKIWNRKGELLQSLDKTMYPIDLSNDGKYLATAGEKDRGYIWEFSEEK